MTLANPIDAALADPASVTLDECLRRAPSLLKPSDLKHMITILRAERASFAVKAEKAAAKRDGVEDVEELEKTGEE